MRAHIRQTLSLSTVVTNVSDIKIRAVSKSGRCAMMAILGVAVMATDASANLLLNGGFEDANSSFGTNSTSSNSGFHWTFQGGGAAMAHPAPNGGGSRWVSTSQIGYSGNVVALIQNLSSISQSFVSNFTGTAVVSWVDAGRDLVDLGNETYTASLFDVTTSTLVGSATLSTTTNSNFNAESFTVPLVNGDSYTLKFQGLNSSGDQSALFDNVNVSNASDVPEPASLALFGIGAAALGMVRRRRV